MACVGKKIAKYTASNSLMVNNCVSFPKPSAATSTTIATATNPGKLEHQTVQHQLTVARALNGSAHHLSGGSCVGGPLASCVQKRHRTTFSSRQLKVLEEAFEQNNYPCAAFREQIASRAHLELSRVQVWFQNRRAKHKKQMNQAMRCFAAAAAAATSTAASAGLTSQHQQIHAQPFTYQAPHQPPPDFFQQNHHQHPQQQQHQSPGGATLQLTTPATSYNNAASHQQESSHDGHEQHLNHLQLQSPVYLRQTNALSQQTLNFNHTSSNNNPGQQTMLPNQSHFHLRAPNNDSCLQLQMHQHQLQVEQEQQDNLSASSFGDTEANFSHILNTTTTTTNNNNDSIYSTPPHKLNQVAAGSTNQQEPPVLFSSSQAGAIIDHSRAQPRQQPANQLSTPASRDTLDYLY